MKKTAVKAGFLAALPLAAVIMQHSALALGIGDLDPSVLMVDSYQKQDHEEGNVLAAETHEPAAVAATEPAEEPKKPVIVTVKKGDTLSKIAKAHDTTYRRLFDANKFIKDPNIINPGEKIRVPEADEKLAKRTLPAPKPVARTTHTTRSSRTTYKQVTYTSNAPAVASGSVWDRLAACESGGNWAINTGNGYFGGLQFLPSTWRGVGGTGLPHQHSREEQIKRGKILQARSGWGQWPACARKLGLL